MDLVAEVRTLSTQFYAAYPSASYPEILYKNTRPYNCLLIDIYDDYFICLPYRSHISHSHAFHFKTSQRSRRNRSGLDYSKMVIIKNPNYISNQPGIVDRDEYIETQQNLSVIATEAVTYLKRYIAHRTGQNPLSPQQYQRDFGHSTLPYFDSELMLPNNQQKPEAV